MRRVLDASVIVKWFLDERPQEELVGAAKELFARVRSREDDLVQPAHWCAEVLSVLARTEPGLVESVVDLLDILALEVADDWAVYRRAAELSVQLNHHLFDTLYHAVAIEYGAELVTADQKYFNKARGLGAIALLR